MFYSEQTVTTGRSLRRYTVCQAAPSIYESTDSPAVSIYLGGYSLYSWRSISKPLSLPMVVNPHHAVAPAETSVSEATLCLLYALV
jgi:hypothetical protein